MRIIGSVRRISRAHWLLVALILSLPVLPAQAVPCDGDRLDMSSTGTRNVEVVLAMDEAWRQSYGVGAEARARQLLADVNRILTPAGIGLSAVSYRSWSSTEYAESMSSMLTHLDASVAALPGQLVIGLTGRQISSVDGIAHVAHIHLVARLHPDMPQRDGFVVAHEIGHLLGAEHHTCDHDYQCVMAPKGFAFPPRWCEHHILEMHLGVASLGVE